MRTVAAIAYDGVLDFELSLVNHVFGVDRSNIGTPWYRYLLCAAEPPPLRTSAGLTISTPFRLEHLSRADTVIVPGWRDEEEQPPQPLLEALCDAGRRGARLLSICTGAFVLAAAGLLDGRRATTHWQCAHLLARRYPRIRVDPSVLYVDDGEVLTSAGVAAGIDLCLHVVRRDYGAEVANTVARRMVVPPHREGGQAQYIELPLPRSANGDPLSSTLDWMRERLAEPLTVDQLARRTHMSPRTFARGFRAVTGTTPQHWVLQQRLLWAQRLLETTDEPVEQVARTCGFGMAANLRRHFRRMVGTSPLAYRRTFRGFPISHGQGEDRRDEPAPGRRT